MHLLGYEFDPEHPALVAELRRVLDGRDNRLPDVLRKLAEHGIDITLEDVAAQSGDAAASGRPHIADAMVAKGTSPIATRRSTAGSTRRGARTSTATRRPC